LQDGDDALHAFDEFADLCGGHAIAGGRLAEPEFGGFAAVESFGDPVRNGFVRSDDISPEQGAAMLDYYAKLVGVDHVGIAVDDMHSIEKVVGFSNEDLEKIYGRNKMRVFDHVWK
jgi:microsomal dipeptidase-like Zn-dependent dipeptidase